MSKRRISLDFDDVIVDLNTSLSSFHNDLYGTSYDRSDVMAYDLQHVWNCTPNEVVQRVFDFYHSDYHKKLLPMEGAIEAIEQLAKDNLLAIVTSRPDSIREITVELLETLCERRASEFF